MNLLREAWIPAAEGDGLRHATLQEVLCSGAALQLRLGRDDMELAALQLAVCLTQVFLPPADENELRARAGKPLPAQEYDAAVARRADDFDPDWFDLAHPDRPFMQTRGVKAEKDWPIQKIFTGLPSSNSSVSRAFFNAVDEVGAVCAPCAAIAVFNQAANAPSFGGGFNGSLRGNSPITTLARGDDLRETLWLNVLHRRTLDRLGLAERGVPTWIDPVPRKSAVRASEIGLLRGLFWQPAHLQLLWKRGPARCDSCRLDAPGDACTGLKAEKFPYKLSGAWPHPHTPRQWSLKEGARKESFVSFRSEAPAWTQTNAFLMERKDDAEGWSPAPVVTQYRGVFPDRRLELIVGGYQSRQAKILARRHELISLTAGWQDHLETVREFVELTLEAKDVLKKESYDFGKTLRTPALARSAEESFYEATEEPLHRLLREMDWKQAGTARAGWAKQLQGAALEIFERLAEPYRRQPKAMRQYFKTRRSLRDQLAKTREGVMIEPMKFLETCRRFEKVLSPGERADLRRAAGLDDLSLRPAYYRVLPPGTEQSEGWRRVAFLLPVARHRDGGPGIGALLRGEGGHPLVSEMRLFQMVRAKGPQDLLHLRRLCRHAEAALDWRRFGPILYYWTQEDKRRIVEEYFVPQRSSRAKPLNRTEAVDA